MAASDTAMMLFLELTFDRTVIDFSNSPVASQSENQGGGDPVLDQVATMRIRNNCLFRP
jgi:hypothetical protein